MISSIQINYTLKNGMLITRARFKKTRKFVKLFITDLQHNARAILNLDDKHIVYCNAAIEFTPEDVVGLVDTIVAATKKKTSTETEKK